MAISNRKAGGHFFGAHLLLSRFHYLSSTILTFPLLVEKENWAPRVWSVTGMSLLNLPEPEVWRTVIEPSFGIVTVTVPDAVSTFSAEGTIMLLIETLPEEVSVFTL